MGSIVHSKMNFYPRSPCGERQEHISVFVLLLYDFYPRSPCGERRIGQALDYVTKEISIHALLAESDLC